MARRSLREKIVESGVETLHQRGFGASGVREITSIAGVPQGSFTNHFRSKEAFGIAVIDRYVERTQKIMAATLNDTSRRPIRRLHAYFDVITNVLQAAGFRYGCLVGNMSLEASEHSELIRERLMEVCRTLTQSLAVTVRAAQHAGELRSDLHAQDIAAFVFSAWQGAMLRTKVDRGPEPLQQFKHVLFTVIKPDSTAPRVAKRPAATPHGKRRARAG